MQFGLLRMLWRTWIKHIACDVTRIDTDPLNGNLILNPKLRGEGELNLWRIGSVTLRNL